MHKTRVRGLLLKDPVLTAIATSTVFQPCGLSSCVFFTKLYSLGAQFGSMIFLLLKIFATFWSSWGFQEIVTNSFLLRLVAVH